MPEVPRSEAGRAYVSRHYEDIGELWADRLDGLIVTGTEPRAPLLQEEPYWTTLTKVVEWAEDHTISTIWSCLAAHAAVLHLDGIQRRPFREKLSGVFECDKVADHAIVSGSARSMVRAAFADTTSLSEEELVSKGYCIVSRSPEVGADMFVNGGESLFVFTCKAIPNMTRKRCSANIAETSARSSPRERESYPDMPRGYFDDETAART